MIKGMTLDQWLFAAVIALAFLALVVYIWSIKPSDEKIQSIETGQHDRLLDERHQQVTGRSAISTLYAMMAVILVGGSLYDMLVTRLDTDPEEIPDPRRARRATKVKEKKSPFF